MNRKLWIPLLSLGMVALVAIGFIFARPLITANASGSSASDPAAPAAPALTGTYYWSYAAKFVCGFQPVNPSTAAGEPVVKPGNYATEINIHNPNFKGVLLIKRFIVLVDGALIVREPLTAGTIAVPNMDLPANSATLDDCNGIWVATHTNPVVTPPNPMPSFIGYLLILSPLDLNVNAVFTTNAPGDLGQVPSSSSIDVLTVAGKRVFVPTGVNP